MSAGAEGHDAEPASTTRAEGAGDLVAGGIAVALGVAVVLYVQGFPSLPGGEPGPALFPGIIGGGFVLFGLALIAQTLHRRRSAVPAGRGESPHPAHERRDVVNAAAVVTAVVVYLLVVDVAGFPLTMSVLLLALIRLLGARWLVAAASAVGTTVVLVLLFQELLLVPLPTGILG